MKTFLVTLLCLFGLAAGMSRAQTTPAHPNIILIFIDDMGYGDIEPFGSTLNKTPNLDRMASEGLKLTNFYDAPVCSVSRAQAMTGCFGQRVSIPGVFGPDSKTGISSSEHTVAELLKAQGYATMIIGKWHLGDQPEFLPTRHGFDHYFGFPYSNDMGRPSALSGIPVMPLIQDEKVIRLVTGPEQDVITEEYTDHAVKYITENKDHPFFLYLAHMAVHMPIHPGKDFQGKSANGRYGDWVQEVDYSVGRIMDTLRQLKLDQNTMVVFNSDNGPFLPGGKDGGVAGPLRGGKGSTWEGGMREPFLAWWPGHIKPGTVSDGIGSNVDFLPTFVSLAGGTVPATPKIDGVDLSPFLLGKTNESPRTVMYYYYNWWFEAVRSGPWKLAFRPQSEGLNRKIVPPDAATNTPRLYNLDTDIGERNDVAAQHPDIVARLQVLEKNMAADLGIDGKQGPGVRPPGRVDHPMMLYPTKGKNEVIDYE